MHRSVQQCSIYHRLVLVYLLTLFRAEIYLYDPWYYFVASKVSYVHIYSRSDIDECQEQSPCDANAMCTNTLGSFTCVCNDGYQGDGLTCTGQF